MNANERIREDIKNVGLSEAMHEKLKELCDKKIFKQEKDGYRLAVSIALHRKIDVNDRNIRAQGHYKNKYDTGGVDEDYILKNAIGELYPEHKGKEYTHLE